MRLFAIFLLKRGSDESNLGTGFDYKWRKLSKDYCYYVTILQVNCLISILAASFSNEICKFIGGKRINFSQRRQYRSHCALAVLSDDSEHQSCYYLFEDRYGKSSRSKMYARYVARRTSSINLNKR